LKGARTESPPIQVTIISSTLDGKRMRVVQEHRRIVMALNQLRTSTESVASSFDEAAQNLQIDDLGLQGRQIAEGWRVWSREPEGFEIGLDSEIRHGGTKSAFIKSKREGSYSIGAGAMQTFAADAYRGKRIRLSAYLKADQVIGKAGLWMRCDSQTKIVAFDNMRDRKITGTSDWQKYEIVLDVPEESVSISFGFTLGSGTGQIWADDFQLEVVGLDVPITDMSIGDPFTGKNVPPEQPKPLNLDFEK
jgi:hypothetical protein